MNLAADKTSQSFPLCVQNFPCSCRMGSLGGLGYLLLVDERLEPGMGDLPRSRDEREGPAAGTDAKEMAALAGDGLWRVGGFE
jgi:hypothetical protein